jgi:hypothetical protein
MNRTHYEIVPLAITLKRIRRLAHMALRRQFQVTVSTRNYVDK